MRIPRLRTWNPVVMMMAWTACLTQVQSQENSLNFATQDLSVEVVSGACQALDHVAVTQTANGRVEKAEAAISVALTSGDKHLDNSCAGLVLTNMAAFLSVSGRFVEAERIAARSIKILEKSYPPDDPVLLRPLQILAVAQYDQGKIAKVRETFQRMQRIRIERPGDRALVHDIAAALLRTEGRLNEAAAEFLAAICAREESGRGETADTASVLTVLAALYIEGRRFDDARWALGRAEVIFSSAKDTVPLDWIKLLNLRAVAHARKKEWRDAEKDLHQAVCLADREAQLDPHFLEWLLVNYAEVLHKTHQRREARSIEARAAAFRGGRVTPGLVDVIELSVKAKAKRK